MKKTKLTSAITIIVLLVSGLFFSCDPDDPGADADLYLYIGLSLDCAGRGALDEAATSVNGIYAAGDEVTASASAASGSGFAGWYNSEQGGTLVSSENPYKFNIEADTFLYASFSDSATVVDPSDSKSPAEVSDFSISHVGGGFAIMNWTDPADSDFDHVEISVSPADISTATVSGGIESATLTGLSSETTYTISLKTVDVAGNTSSGIAITMSIPASFTTITVDMPASIKTMTIITDSDGAALNSILASDLSGYYILLVDVDLDGVSWTPVGNGSSNFTGTFDGGGHTISNLTLSSSDYYQGLFGYSSGTLLNVCLEAVSVTGTGHAGGLAGRSVGGIIRNCSAAGDVSGTSSVGGLAGSNTGTITDCYAAGNISGTTSNVGGLVGYNNGPVIGSHAAGTVSGPQHVGGLMGKNDNTVSDSYASGAVSGSYAYIGGLTGENNGGTVSNCHASGDVSSTGDCICIGGLVGRNSGGTVASCYATGAVSIATGLCTSQYAGGLVGHNNGQVIRSHASGTVSGSSYGGGLVGQNYDNGTITNCYATGSASGNYTSGGLVGKNYSTINYSYANGTINTSLSIIGTNYGTYTGSMLTTAQMQLSGFYGSSWDFTDTWAISSSVNNGYPYLQELADSY